MRIFAIALVLAAVAGAAQGQTYRGQLSVNPLFPPAPPSPPGLYNNPYGTSLNSPRLYDQQGRYRGNLNANRYDPNSIANPYGRYGSRYSQDSINNPYGAGSRYRSDSPNNPYGSGWSIWSD